MMDLIEQRIDQGLSDQQILDELLASYSGALLLDPPAGRCHHLGLAGADRRVRRSGWR